MIPYQESDFLSLINKDNFLTRMSQHVEKGSVDTNKLSKEIYSLSFDQRLEYIGQYLSVVFVCREYGQIPAIKDFKKQFISFDDNSTPLFMYFLNRQNLINTFSKIMRQEFKNTEHLRFKTSVEILNDLCRAAEGEVFYYHKIFTNANSDFVYLLTKNDKEEIVGMMDIHQDGLVKREVLLDKFFPNKNGTSFSPFELTKVYKKNKIKNKMNEQFVQSE